MTERTDDVRIQNEDETEHGERVYFPDGGVVAPAPAASTPTGIGQQLTTGGGPSQGELEPRTKRARTEEMDVSLLQKGRVYGIQLEPGNIYEVNVANEAYTCPDFSRRSPGGGCKYLRRTDLETRSGNVPRPDGRLSETTDVAEQLSTEIRELEREVEECVEQRRKLETTVGVLKEFLIE